jgi:hypothetical protein
MDGKHLFLHFGGKTTRTFDEFCFTDLIVTHIPRATFLGEFESEEADGKFKEGILYDRSNIICWNIISCPVANLVPT